jgi:hypothetical protein
VVNVTPRPPYPQKKILVYQLNGKLDVLEKRNICASAGFRIPDIPSANLASILSTLCWLLCVSKFFMLSRCDSCLGRSYRVFNFNFADLLCRVVLLTGSDLNRWALQQEPLAVKRKVAEQTGCHGDMVDDDLASCLRAKSLSDL